MLTNILLITLLILLISAFVYFRKLIIKVDKGNYSTYKELDGRIISKSRLMLEQVDLNGVMARNMLDGVQKSVNDILIQYTQRLEMQEKLITELKKTQAPEEVTDTVNLISEWLNGKQEV